MALPKTGLLSIIISKILLEHSHTHLIHTVCVCFQATQSELSSCDRCLMSHKA